MQSEHLTFDGIDLHIEYDIVKPGNRDLEPKHVQIDKITTMEGEDPELTSYEEQDIRRKIAQKQEA